MVGSIPTGSTMIHLVGMVGIFVILGVIAANKYDDIQTLMNLQGVMIFVLILACVLELYGVNLPL
jgi:hypothetical protein